MAKKEGKSTEAPTPEEVAEAQREAANELSWQALNGEDHEAIKAGELPSFQQPPEEEGEEAPQPEALR